MNKYIKKCRKIERYLEIGLKSIPIVVVLFFLGSFFLNLGYFSSLGLSLMSLMSLSDYYEGSLFSIYYIGIILFSLLLLNVIQASILMLYKIIVLCARLLFAYIIILMKSIKLRIKFLFMMKKMRRKNNNSEKKRELEDIIAEEKKLFTESSDHFYSGIKISSKTVIKLLFLVLVCCAVITNHLYCVYVYNWELLIVIGILYLSFRIVQKHRISKIGFLFVLFLFYFMGMYDLGLMLASPHPGKAFFWNPKICSISRKMYVDINEGQYMFMRSLDKGVLVKKDEEIFFFRWEDIQFFHQKNEQARNAKK